MNKIHNFSLFKLIPLEFQVTFKGRHKQITERRRVKKKNISNFDHNLQ